LQTVDIVNRLHPLAGKVILKIIERKEVTYGGVILPESVDKYSYKAEVIAVGKDVEEIKPGMTVIFLPNANVKFRKERLIVVSADEIIAELTEDK